MLWHFVSTFFLKMLKFWSLWKKHHWIRVLSLKTWGYKSDFPAFSFRSQFVCVIVNLVLWSGDRWIPVHSIACLIYNEIVWLSERHFLKKIKRRLREEVIYSTSYSDLGIHRSAFLDNQVCSPQVCTWEHGPHTA